MKKKVAVYKTTFYVVLVIALVTALYMGAYDFNHSVFEIVSTYLKTKNHTAICLYLLNCAFPEF